MQSLQDKVNEWRKKAMNNITKQNADDIKYEVIDESLDKLQQKANIPMKYRDARLDNYT
jgi:hypothetical protein